MLYYDIPRVPVDRVLYIRTRFKRDSIKKLVEISKEQNIDCDKIFQGKVKILVINCYNI